MTGYNLDEKTGLFSGFGIKANKLIKKDDTVDVKHYNMFNFLKAVATDITENSIRIQSKEKYGDLQVLVGDPIVINYTNSGEVYSISATLSQVFMMDPLEAIVKINKIEKMKDLRKFERFFVSYSASVKILGVSENKFAAVKNISLGGLKVNCKEDIMLEDVIEMTVTIDKVNKLSFTGRVVRKGKTDNYNEYGIEFIEMSENNSKILHHCISQLTFG
ncbi:MAG TPA: PilZ domain-containing protein [Clostridia bacterium]|nr:PilZ domain-containing protein [Clostridia bacterium]